MIPLKENARFLRVLNMSIHTLITKLDACKFLFLSAFIKRPQQPESGPQPLKHDQHVWFSDFFPNILRFWFQKKAHIFFSKAHEKFDSWNMFHLEDIGKSD